MATNALKTVLIADYLAGATPLFQRFTTACMCYFVDAKEHGTDSPEAKRAGDLAWEASGPLAVFIVEWWPTVNPLDVDELLKAQGRGIESCVFGRWCEVALHTDKDRFLHDVLVALRQTGAVGAKLG